MAYDRGLACVPCVLPGPEALGRRPGRDGGCEGGKDQLSPPGRAGPQGWSGPCRLLSRSQSPAPSSGDGVPVGEMGALGCCTRLAQQRRGQAGGLRPQGLSTRCSSLCGQVPGAPAQLRGEAIQGKRIQGCDFQPDQPAPRGRLDLGVWALSTFRRHRSICTEKSIVSFFLLSLHI